jgi:hypothetical protein
VTAKGLRDALDAKDDLVVLHLDGASFTPAETLEILDVIKYAMDQGMTDHLVAYVSDASGTSALLALACPKIVLSPGATLKSLKQGELVGSEGVRVRSLMQAICPERSEIVEAFCTMRPLVHVAGPGWHTEDSILKIMPVRGQLVLSEQDAISTGLAAGTAKTLKTTHLSLGRRGMHVYQDRTVGMPRGAQSQQSGANDKVLFQIDRQLKELNEGLKEAFEGIAIFLGPGRTGLKNRRGTLFDRVKNGWRGGDNDRVRLSEDDAEDSKKAQGLIKDGLKDVEDAASKLERYLKQGYTDPRLAKAVAYAKAVKPLYFALRGDRDPTDFKAKCQVVVDCDPL